MPVCRRAGDEGVQPFDAVDQALREKKGQRPVDRRRCRTRAAEAKPVKETVGTHRTVRLEHQAQDIAAQPGEPRAVLLALHGDSAEPRLQLTMTFETHARTPGWHERMQYYIIAFKNAT